MRQKSIWKKVLSEQLIGTLKKWIKIESKFHTDYQGGYIMTVLVTGAGGFIGKYIVEALLKAGHKVKAWDIAFEKNYFPEADVICVNILDEKVQKEVLRDCEAVVHACYYNDVTDINHHFEVNTIASWRLLKNALECRVKYFVYLSTYLLYNPELSNVASFVETDAVFSKDFYTANKLAIEGYCRSFSKCYALKCIVLRLGAAYGVYRKWEALSRPPYSMQMKLAIENKTIEVFGQSPLIWAGDVAGAIVAILDNPGKTSELYNVVDFNLRWEDCAKKIIEIVGSNSKIVSVKPAHKPIVVNGERLKKDFNLKFVGLKGFEDFLKELKDKILRQQF